MRLIAAQPIEIALQGIDFSIMGQVTEWLGQRPGGKRIGGKS